MKFSDVKIEDASILSIEEKRAFLFGQKQRNNLFKVLTSFLEEETSMDQKTISLMNLISQLLVSEKLQANVPDQVGQFALDLQKLSDFCLDLSMYYLSEQSKLKE